ncbi:MAG: acetate/propionate family kinase [Pirellulales bacterium]
MTPPNPHLLAINTGSTSLKAALFRLDETRELTAAAGALGTASATLVVRGAEGETLHQRTLANAEHADVLAALLEWLAQAGLLDSLAAVGHRVVHGGPKFAAPCRVSEVLLEELERILPLDPEHLPQALGAIHAIAARLPGLPQVACFDTAFHRGMPAVAKLLPLPARYRDAGVERYGFHGLSYQYLVEQLRTLDPPEVGGRAVLAHLGGGASLAAVLRGQPLDTTMGFTPTGGLVMGTRTGDLDPGVLLYLLTVGGLSAKQLARLVNQEAGMLAVSGVSGEMRELLLRRAGDPAAAGAVALFCYQARKLIASMTSALGGLDTLVFAGGIGEHAAEVRAEICAGLEFLGVHLDPGRNAQGAPIVSSGASAVVVRVLPTDEERMICRLCVPLLARNA